MFGNRLLASTTLVLVLAGTSSAQEVEEDAATIKGKVVFKGDADKYKPRPIEVPSDSKCTPGTPLFTEGVVLNLDTTPVTVRNAVVSIKEGPVDRRYRHLQGPQLMETKNCRFDPHVVALLAELPIDVRNEDPVAHNVHFMAKKNREHNFTIPKKGMQMSVVMEAEDPIEIKSDRCPWMGAWILVFDHPYFVITEEPGTFKFDGVPAGKYVLEAWHETFGKQTATVEVAAGETKEVDFTYEPDKK